MNHRRIVLILAVATWFVGLGYGSWEMVRYTNQRADVENPPASWPDECDLERDPQRPTLFVSIHPHCVCTRATLNELDRLLVHHRDQVQVFALFMLPDGCSPEWCHTNLWKQASAMPSVRTVIDLGGRYQRMFRMRASGEVALYGRQGQLQFHGGITAGRGHEGDNAGCEAISDLLASDRTACERTPVYGCCLSDAASAAEEIR